MATARESNAEILAIWRKLWRECFPDVPPNNKNLLEIRKQWMPHFSAQLVVESLRKTAAKWKDGTLIVDGKPEDAICRYTRGILNRESIRTREEATAPTGTASR